MGAANGVHNLSKDLGLRQGNDTSFIPLKTKGKVSSELFWSFGLSRGWGYTARF